MSKVRHHGDILEFTTKNNNHLYVSDATFNLFVRGEDWLTENDPNLWTRSSNAAPETSSSKQKGSGNVGDSGASVLGSSMASASASEPATATATARDEHNNFATSSDSFHKLHSNSKNVNNKYNHISISINRFVHRHQQQVSAYVIYLFSTFNQQPTNQINIHVHSNQMYNLYIRIYTYSANKLLTIMIDREKVF